MIAGEPGRPALPVAVLIGVTVSPAVTSKQQLAT